MKATRVLMVLDTMDVSGTETHVLSLVKELQSRGIYTAVLTGNGSMISRLRETGCTIHEMNFPATLTLKPETESLLLKGLVDLIRQERITLVHGHQITSGHISAKAAKISNIPFVFTLHGTYFPDWEIRSVLQFTDAAIAVSEPVKKYIQPFFPKNISVIANGIDITDFSPSPSLELRKKMNIPLNAKVIVYCSRITRHKAKICMLLIKACRDLKLNDISNLHVIIVGDGSQLKDIKNMAASIQSSCKEEFIHFTGEQKNVRDYYAFADYVVGTGRVALEAMACEKPIISCGNHGYFGTVDGNNFQQAWECYFGDHAAKQTCNQAILYQDLRNLHQSNTGVQTGKDLRKLVVKQFDSKKNILPLIELYESTIQSFEQQQAIN
ncbi:glycosyltransferase [Peribacillus sp. NPDC097895]|uniref:glycosyltransferase n=1 Tax=Peribacillus sp. NPDC097895 TaxID=3390619 RepID=UPI003D0761ED